MRNRVWIAILNAERNSRYFEELASRYRRRQFLINFGITFGSLGAAATLLAEWSVYLTVGLFVVTATSTSWAMLADYSRKVVLCDVAQAKCAELGVTARNLWFEDKFDAVEEISRLELQLNRAQTVDIGVDIKLNKRSAEQAYEWAKHEFIENANRSNPNSQLSNRATEPASAAPA